MEQYIVTGMSCEACRARVEKAVSSVEGVTLCSVNLLTNSMGVEGSASPSDIIKAVENAGYGAAQKKTDNSGKYSARLAAEEDALKDRETPKMKKRLVVSIVFLLVLMYFSMGVSMWGWPVPPFIPNNHIAVGLVQLLLAAAIMVINQKFFTGGFKSLFKGAPNMDTLIALGSSAAFVYSTVMLFAMTSAHADGNSDAVMGYMNELYFESAGTILTLITVGKTLEAYSKGKTTDALKGLMKLAPKNANIIRDGKEITVSVDEVVTGDIFVVRPGENIPVDGVVIEGESAVNEAALTGESIPADKAAGSTVSSATLNQSGFLKCRATRVGEDTTLSQIISMVSDAAATKAPVAKIADKISLVFVPAVIAISVITIAVWLLMGAGIGTALAKGICVLVVSCPCALGLATPVAIMVGNGMGARSGILFKTAESLQETGRVQIVALDKTGTVTSGKPKVTDIIPVGGTDVNDLLYYAVSLESKSEHPLAGAVTEYAEKNKTKSAPVSNFKAVAGNGLTANLDGQDIYGGNERFISKYAKITSDVKLKTEELSRSGKTPMLFSKGNVLLGIIAVADTVKDDSAQAISEMKKMGIRVVMLTGDNKRTAEAVGKAAGVDEVIAEVLPDGKESVIRRLKEKGKTAMIGDGINDAPALTRADVGIAIGAGADVAIDAADVVLMKSRLSDASAAIRLSRKTYKNIKENLFWAFIYNILLIPLAAGVYSSSGIVMTPMWGAAAMSFSSVFVVLNALRLNLFNIYNAKRDRKYRNSVVVNNEEFLLGCDQTLAEGGEVMTKTIKIEGMMCSHCEATVKKALEEIDGVSSAEVSHESGTAKVTLSADVDDSKLIEAIESKDYKVKGVE